MKEFTNEEGYVFVKLYKKENSVFHYWEAWKTDGYTAVIHWGILGKMGEDIEIIEPSLNKFKKEINKLINQKINEGYNEISIEKQYTLAITFQLDNWGNIKDLERREELRKFISWDLGWTGIGRCDDGEIGSRTMRLFADVIDPYIAIKIISSRFKLRRIPEKPEFMIMYQGKVIESNYRY